MNEDIFKDHIMEAEGLLLQAMKTSDVPALETMLHDDLLFIAPNGQAITKTIDLDTHRSGVMRVDEMLPDMEQINIVGDNAIVILNLQIKGTMAGDPVEGKFRYIRVWKRTGDGLKIIAGSCTQVHE